MEKELAQDKKTISFYAQEAEPYTSRGRKADTRHLETFLSLLSADATILELGCGGGQDSEFMISKGFNVRPTDGTPEIARAAEQRLGIPVAPLMFDELDEEGTCDGIWANACLLHVPRGELQGILGRVYRALKPGGVFYASFKAGESEGRDMFDRYYNYPSEAWLSDLYAAFSWQSVTTETGQGRGYDGKLTGWLFLFAVK